MTTWKQRLIRAGAVLLVFAGGWTTGKYASPAKVVERVRVETRDVVRTVEVAAKATQEAVQEHVHVVERIVYRPGETTVVRETVRDDQRQAATQEQHHSDTQATHAALAVSERTIARAVRSRWAMDAFVGAGLDGAHHYGGGAEMRVVGPLWLTAKVDVAARAGLVGLRLEF